MNPTGTVVWEEKVQGAGLTAQSDFRHIALIKLASGARTEAAAS